jgi:hypothetical protein
MRLQCHPAPGLLSSGPHSAQSPILQGSPSCELDSVTCTRHMTGQGGTRMVDAGVTFILKDLGGVTAPVQIQGKQYTTALTHRGMTTTPSCDAQRRTT